MSRDWENDRRENPPPEVRPYCARLPRPDHELDYLMAEYLGGRGLSWDLAVTNYWFPSRSAGDSSPRIVIPATSKIDGNVYWQARAMDDNPKRYQSPFAPRGDAVVVVWPVNRRISRSVVVEGPMDALAGAGEGALGVALMGATPSPEALDLTAALIHGTICTVLADSDAIEAAVYTNLALIDRGVTTTLVCPSEYKDLAATPKEKRRALIAPLQT